VVINQEDAAERFFLLTSGHGRQFVITGDGKKILLLWLTAGQIFGGAAILSTPSQYLASTELRRHSEETPRQNSRNKARTSAGQLKLCLFLITPFF
jgi:CRP-like cAMP-binding protein